MVNNYRRGYIVERICVRELRNDGYRAQRNAGSHGIWDVTAFNENCVRLIQCKRVKNKKDVKNVADGNLEILKNVQVPRFAMKELWVWLDGDSWVCKQKL